MTPTKLIFHVVGDFRYDPTMSERMCNRKKKKKEKKRKRNVALEKRLVTIPYKGSRKKNTKEKAEI